MFSKLAVVLQEANGDPGKGGTTLGSTDPTCNRSFHASPPGCQPSSPPDDACIHQYQISETDSTLRMARRGLPRTANGLRVPAMKPPLRRLRPRCAGIAFDWRIGAACWWFAAGSHRARA